MSDNLPIVPDEVLEPAIVKLLSNGMDPWSISSLLDVPISTVKRITKVKVIFSQEDKELLEAVRNLVWSAVGKAHTYLHFGTPTQKFQMTKLLVASATKMIGKETTSDFEEARNSLGDILNRMKDDGAEEESA
jgi:hypothetical protein